MMLNQRWVNLPDKEWDAKLEIMGEKLSIIIFCKKEFKQIYIVPKFDRFQLKKFMRLTRQNDKINFGHVVSEKDGTDKIARTSINNSVWVLPIRNIEVYNIS